MLHIVTVDHRSNASFQHIIAHFPLFLISWTFVEDQIFEGFGEEKTVNSKELNSK